MAFDHPRTVNISSLMSKCAALGMQDFASLIHISHYVLETAPLDGALVEFGCYKGDTAKLITALTTKPLYVYDSFAGLPDTGETTPGEMAVSINTLVENFQADNLRLPIIRKGWFNELSAQDLPEKISFAHLDGDLYSSTMEALRLVYGKLVPGAVLLIDDYDNRENREWHGPRNAVHEFFGNKAEKPVELRGINGDYLYKALIKKR
jgi:O-methyltransferase